MKELIRRTRKSFTSGDRQSDPQIPDNMWAKCPACGQIVYSRELEDNMKVCPKCGYHHRLSAREWLTFLDTGSFEERDMHLLPMDPLEFVSLDVSYAEKLQQAQKKTGLTDAVTGGVGTIEGIPLVIAICDFSFMGASMGSV
ncbi:MAG: acetyl-CoA carboxylase carboxyl transferase subunit beta, partial [Blastochloris sp.]|nr:acetyl-CoA carboxylase carboxyl transferase subunit beta [Blastochloris sp.]